MSLIPLVKTVTPSDIVSALNSLINQVNAGSGGGAAVPLPFVGTASVIGWTRPSLSTFSTWLNQAPSGLSTATATDNTGGKPLVLSTLQDDITSGGCLTALLKTIGAPPWTITVGAAAFSTLSFGATTGEGAAYNLPIVLYDSAHDRAVTMTWWGGLGTGANISGQVRIAHYPDTILDSGTQSFVGPVGNGFPFPDYFEWFRVANDGTTLTFSISPDGLLFFEIYSESATALLGTIDKVGFGVDRANFGVTPPSPLAALLWSWVES